MSRTTIFAMAEDPRLRDALASALAPLGTVSTPMLWTDAAEAIGRGPHMGRRLLVCDLGMTSVPVMHFCRILRASAPDLRVVMLTSFPHLVPPGIAHEVVERRADSNALQDAVRRALVGPAELPAPGVPSEVDLLRDLTAPTEARSSAS